MSGTGLDTRPAEGAAPGGGACLSVFSGSDVHIPDATAADIIHDVGNGAV
jgi:hypothetical protein